MQANKEILDFIIIGAQKAGTTSLFHYLRHHPEISLPAGKERPHFSHDPRLRAWLDGISGGAHPKARQYRSRAPVGHGDAAVHGR